jgi:hypothetical protein
VACSGCRMRAALDLDRLAAAQLLFGLGGRAVDADLSGIDQQLHSRAADVGNRLGEVSVQPHSRRGAGGKSCAHRPQFSIVFIQVEIRNRRWRFGSASTPRVARYSARTDDAGGLWAACF